MTFIYFYFTYGRTPPDTNYSHLYKGTYYDFFLILKKHQEIFKKRLLIAKSIHFCFHSGPSITIIRKNMCIILLLVILDSDFFTTYLPIVFDSSLFLNKLCRQQLFRTKFWFYTVFYFVGRSIQDSNI